jgi:hypothetical protein
MTNEQAVESLHVKYNNEARRHKQLKGGRVRITAMFNTHTTKCRAALGSKFGAPVKRPKYNTK